MRGELPVSLKEIVGAQDEGAREDAWASFLAEHSRLLLHVARSMARDHDEVMDRYAFVLEALRKDEFRRLKAFHADAGSSFTTWLVAVTRRLCVDAHRQKYGRPRTEQSDSSAKDERARLIDLLGAVDSVDDFESPNVLPDQELEDSERLEALERSLALLPPSDRLLLRMRFDDGLPVPQIAQILGEQTPFATYRRIDRILSFLRKTMVADGIEGLA